MSDVTTQEHCDECGYVYDPPLVPELDRLLRDTIVSFAALLDTDPDQLRFRPGPNTWSALEYAGHVRDVLLAQRERLYLMLVEDQPTLVPIHAGARVVLARYNERDPIEVAEELSAACRLFSHAVAILSDAQRQRTCVAYFYNDPGRQVRTVDWLALHTLHECRHHLADTRASVTPPRLLS